jgi:tRNA U34 2-thiouridine synthase MnmA/TrmU
MEQKDLEKITSEFGTPIREQLVQLAKQSAVHPASSKKSAMIDCMAGREIEDFYKYNKQRGGFVSSQYYKLVDKFRKEFGTEEIKYAP